MTRAEVDARRSMEFGFAGAEAVAISVAAKSSVVIEAAARVEDGSVKSSSSRPLHHRCTWERIDIRE